ncbi:MAG: DUF3798 domain-containing protein [Candidatus Adiutrix sp.]
MKKLMAFLALALMAIAASPAMALAPFHIGVVTSTVSQGEDELRGAEALIAEYGETGKGGYITHVTYPDNFMSEMETTVSVIAGLADDPKMKVIVVNQGVPGTTEAFRRVAEKRPDILLFSGESHEDPGVISEAATLSVNADNINRGYTIPYGAKEMGAKSFVHISFPRHMSYETLSRRRAIMEVASQDLGLNFYAETAPDPTSDVGVAGAQQFILEKVPAWLEKYGPDTAFFCTNDAHTEPLLKRIAELGGYFVEADLPSPTMGYPGALGIEFTEAEKGNWLAIMKKVEEAVIAAGGEKRMGTWSFSYAYATTAGLAEFGKRIVEGNAQLDNPRDLIASYVKYTPESNWNMAYYTDAGTGVMNKKFALVYQDTYVFGSGYLGITDIEVPEKYYTIK